MIQWIIKRQLDRNEYAEFKFNSFLHIKYFNRIKLPAKIQNNVLREKF